MSDEVVSALADKLGMSKDDLKAKLSSSDDPRKTIDQLAEDKGISKQELQEIVTFLKDPGQYGRLGARMGPASPGCRPPRRRVQDRRRPRAWGCSSSSKSSASFSSIVPPSCSASTMVTARR